MIELPALPHTIRALSDPDAQRLSRLYSGLWANPHETCLTCLRKEQFLGRDGETYRCNCIDQWVLHRFLLNSGVLLNYQRLGWDDVDAQVPGDVQVAIMEYVENAEAYLSVGMGVTLWGTGGTGKTLLASLFLKALLERGYDGYFTQFNTMLDDYTAGWGSGGKADKEWFVRRVMNAGVLVVDDIGKESKGRENVTNSMFDQVIRNRVASDRPTIITTNYTPAEMQSGYGGGVMSLLSEKCLDYEVTGKSFRQRVNERNLAEIKAGIKRPVTLA